MKSFWKNSKYHYADLIDLPLGTLIILVQVMSRQDVVEWLSWNDQNGVYTDEESLKEFGRIMTKQEGIEIIIKQVEENRTF